MRLYRLGLFSSAAGLAATAASFLTARDPTFAGWLLLAGVTLAVAHLHLYAKHIKHVIALGAWTALLLAALPVDNQVTEAAVLGFASIALSGLALKEQFCFRIPFLRAQPVLLGAAVFGVLLGEERVAGVALAGASLLQGLLAVAKMRMPLHYDIGDKSAYQV